jgi:ADP-ribose pyrophosphatase
MPAPVLESARELFASARFRLVDERWRTDDGMISKPIIHHPGAVAVIAQPEPGSLVMVRQFRYAVKRWTLEIPAGTREAGEEPAVTAARELREEAGFGCARISEIMRLYPAVGVSDEELILYRAEGLVRVQAAPELGELIECEEVLLADLPERLRDGSICDAKTLIALSVLGLPVLPSTVRGR